jgi:hypothetical protein
MTARRVQAFAIALAAALAGVHARAVQPPAPASREAPAVLSLTEAREARVVSAALAGGAIVHVRTMDAPAVQVVINLPGGEALETRQTRGLTQLLALALEGAWAESAPMPGPGPNLSLRLQAGGWADGIRLRLTGTPEALEAAAGRVAGLLTGRAGLNAVVVDEAKVELIADLDRRAANPRLRVAEGLGAVMRGEVQGTPPDVRLVPPPVETLRGHSDADVRAWLAEHTRPAGRRGDVEIGIAGDIGLERGVMLGRALAAGLGAEPEQGPDKRVARPWPARQPGPLSGRVQADLGGRALVLVGYVGAEASEVARVRTLRAAAAVLADRARAELRRAGVTVADADVAAGVTVGAQPGFGLLLATAEVDAADHARASAALRASAEALAADGVGAAELEARRGELIATAESFHRDAGYWAGVLARSRAMTLDLDEVARAGAFYKALTPDDVTRELRGVVVEGGRVEVVGGLGSD